MQRFRLLAIVCIVLGTFSARAALAPDGHAASQTELEIWLHGYGEFLKIGAEILHESTCYPEAKIITFGIAHGSIAPGHPIRNLSNPAQAVAMLRDVDGFNYLDNSNYHVVHRPNVLLLLQFWTPGYRGKSEWSRG